MMRYRYELVSEQRTPVLRRGQTFYLAVQKAQAPGGGGGSETGFDLDRDRIKLIFQFGEMRSIWGSKCYCGDDFAAARCSIQLQKLEFSSFGLSKNRR